MTDSLNDLLNSEEWKAYKEKMIEKEKYLKNGPNVIHIEYLNSIFSKTDFDEYENKLIGVGLELSRFDKSCVMYACMDKFDLVTYISLAPPIIVELLKGTGSNVTWDVIKYLLISSWKKIRNKFYTRSTSQISERKEISFGLKVSLDRNTTFNMDLKGDLDEAVIQNSLDKVLDFLREQKANDQYKHPDYVYFDSISEKWIRVDVESEIREMIERGKMNRK
ncbi:MAG: hypothetical protein IH597_11670 [Bacteroidales bacterium]|nr:hypothetical protein [Bacteroidales bacterium]